jgi:serralysin
MAMIKGTAGNDGLVGTSLFDTINAGAGDDWIIGGAGNDKMAGGSGADTFVFTTPSWGNANGADVITDFQVGEDVLHFHNPSSGMASFADLALSQVGTSTVISYGTAGESITLVGVDLGELMSHASTDFLFS